MILKLFLLLHVAVLLHATIIIQPKPSKTINFKLLDEYNQKESEHFKIYWGENIPLESSSWYMKIDNAPVYIDYAIKGLEFAYLKHSELLDVNFSSKKNVIIGNSGVFLGDKEITIGAYEYGYVSFITDINESYMVLNPQMPTITGFLSPKKNIDITTAHELFHVFQIEMQKESFDYNNETKWMYEGSAVWTEDFVYPNLNMYVSLYVSPFFENYNKSMFTHEGLIPYSSVLFFQYIVNRYDYADIFKDMLNLKSMNISNFIKLVEEKTQKSFEAILNEFYKDIFNDMKYINDKELVLTKKSTLDNISFICKYGLYTSTKLEIVENSKFENKKWYVSSLQKNVNSLGVVTSKDDFLINLDDNCSNLDRYDILTPNYISLNSGWNLKAIVNDINISSIDLNVTIWKWNGEYWEFFAKDSKLMELAKGFKIPTINNLSIGDGVWIYSNTDGTIYLENTAIKSKGVFDIKNSEWLLFGNIYQNFPIAKYKNIVTMSWSGNSWNNYIGQNGDGFWVYKKNFKDLK